MKRLRTYFLLCGLVAHVFAAAALVGVLMLFPDHSLGELLHKGRQRLAKDHPTIATLIGVAASASGLERSRKEKARPRSLPPFPGPEAWPAHGTVADGFERPAYDTRGVPRQARPGQFERRVGDRPVRVGDKKSLIKALRKARPGDVITLSPGRYRLNQRRISLGGRGLPDRPIVVRAERIGEVQIELDSLEGFYVDKPYWVFENLQIRGVCDSDSKCEHAFHVVGRAVGTVLRNNELIDFNAPLKVNGLFGDKGDRFPDHGLVHNNTVYNTRIRRTGNPVTLLNINAGDGWVVSANFIADFAKARSNRISYAAFMKSNSRNGVFERNLVVCHWRLQPEGGVRLGLSFGGGGSAARTSRDRDNSVEHTAGIMRNNIIARCPRDVGIYLNKSAHTRVYNNLLIGTTGIDVRFSTSSASIHDNVLDGRIRDRDGGTHTADNNLIADGCGRFERDTGACGTAVWYKSALRGDLALADGGRLLDRGSIEPRDESDFCGNRRRPPTDIGPIDYDAGRLCLPSH